VARPGERAQVPGGDGEMTDTLLDIPPTPPDTGADVKTVDIPVDILQLCDPWLQHLWDLRGTYVGTQIDWPLHEQPCSTSLETGGKVKHGNNQLRPKQDS